MIMKQKYVEVEIELPIEILVNLAMDAHKRNITLNKMINIILANFIKENKNEFKKSKTK